VIEFWKNLKLVKSFENQLELVNFIQTLDMKLDETTIEKKLVRLPEWEYVDNALQAVFEFENFKDCFSAMSRIAFECEAQNHHPEWTNVYNNLTIRLSTHDADGVTLKDFELANAIESIIEEAE